MKTVLVDSGLPGNEANILDAMKANDIGPGDVSLILVTHGHIDHFGSAALMREMLKCPIAMHRSDAISGETGKSIPFKVATTKGKMILPLIERADKEYFYSFKPDIIIDEELDLWHFGLRGKVVSTPGHSIGSVSLVLDNGDAISADLLARGRLFSGQAKMPLYYDSVDETKASAQKLLDMGAKRFFLSHGGMLTDRAVRRFVGVT